MKKIYYKTGYILYDGKHIQGCISRHEAEELLAKQGYDISKLDWTYDKWTGIEEFKAK